MIQKILHDDLMAGSRSFHQRSESIHRLPAGGLWSDGEQGESPCCRQNLSDGDACPKPGGLPLASTPSASLLFQRQSTSCLCSFIAVSTCCDLNLHLTTAKQLSSLTAHSEHLLSTSPDTPPCRSRPSRNPLGTPGLTIDPALTTSTWCLLMHNSELNCTRRTFISSEHPLALTSIGLGDRKQANRWFSCSKTHSFHVLASLKSMSINKLQCNEKPFFSFLMGSRPTV